MLHQVRVQIRSLISVLLLGTSFVAAGPAQAIVIDQFTGEQQFLFGGVNTSQSSVLQTPGVLGGWRSVQVKSLATGFVDVRTGAGTFEHSETVSGHGETVVTWDGDGVVGLSNPAGLGGVDFTADGATHFRVRVVSFDFPNEKPLSLTFTAYDAADPLGKKRSSYTLLLTAPVISPAVIQVPFAGFVPGPDGPASFQNVGALTLSILGSGGANDLRLLYLDTNGKCTDLVPVNGFILDECDVCNGDNKSCADCAGVPNGAKILDRVGQCCLPGQIDQCQKCFGPGPDQCGICDGDGVSCVDCAGVPFGAHVRDQGGVCCLPAEIDVCGVCGGAGKDVCGVCGGNGKSCLDCAGVPNGGAEIDKCGVCAGDGSSCGVCKKERPTAKSRVRVKKVLDDAAVLKQRAEEFAAMTVSCGGAWPTSLQRLERLYKRLQKVAINTYLKIWEVCPESVCTKASSRLQTTKLQKAAADMFEVTTLLKNQAADVCNFTPNSDGESERKSTRWNYEQLYSSIKSLPRKSFKCE